MSVFIAGSTFVTLDEKTPQHLTRELRRADPFITLGVLAVDTLLKVTKPAASLPADCGLCIGTSYGPMDTNFAVLDKVVDCEQTSPTLFSHSVFNGAAGYLARIFKLTGAAVTITDFVFPFFQALQQAMLAVEEGRLSSCLVLQIEAYSELYHDARRTITGEGATAYLPGCGAMLLTGEPNSAESDKLTSLRLDTRSTTGLKYLDVKEEFLLNAKRSPLDSPLAGAQSFIAALGENNQKSKVINIVADYGEVELIITR